MNRIHRVIEARINIQQNRTHTDESNNLGNVSFTCVKHSIKIYSKNQAVAVLFDGYRFRSVGAVAAVAAVGNAVAVATYDKCEKIAQIGNYDE